MPQNDKYPPLNLPPARLRYRTETDGLVRVYDPLRDRFVALTPEEWVRQHFTAWMTGSMGYPSSLMGNEVSLKLNSTSRRCDTVLFSHRGLHPLMIVEYKAPCIEITQRVFDQIARYNMVLNARFLAVSNGLRHFICEVDSHSTSYRFLSSFPTYSQLISYLSEP